MEPCRLLRAQSSYLTFRIVGRFVAGMNCNGLQMNVDAARYGNEMRFMNHFHGSIDDPNVEMVTEHVQGGNSVEPVIVVRVVRDVHEGEELLVDYGDGYWGAMLKKAAEVQIYVQPFGRDKRQMSVTPDERVGELRARVREELGLDYEPRLVFNGHVLTDDSRTLRQYNIQKEAVVHAHPHAPPASEGPGGTSSEAAT